MSADMMRCQRCRQTKHIDAFSGRKSCDECRARRRRQTEARLGRKLNPKGVHLTPTAIIMGRKNCTKCKCWRPVHDFSVQEWDDPIERNTYKVLRPDCKTCQRIAGREKNARLNGRSEPYRQWQPIKKMSAEERRRRHRERHRERMENDPEYAANFRERQRIYADAKRREAGIPVRVVMREKQALKPQVKDDIGLPLEPFQQWVRRRAAFYALREGIIAREGDVAGLTYLANLCGITDRTLRRYLDGYETKKDGSKRIIETVPFGTVDKCLTYEGGTFMWELYPEEDAILAA